MKVTREGYQDHRNLQQFNLVAGTSQGANNAKIIYVLAQSIESNDVRGK